MKIPAARPILNNLRKRGRQGAIAARNYFKGGDVWKWGGAGALTDTVAIPVLWGVHSKSLSGARSGIQHVGKSIKNQPRAVATNTAVSAGSAALIGLVIKTLNGMVRNPNNAKTKALIKKWEHENKQPGILSKLKSLKNKAAKKLKR